MLSMTLLSSSETVLRLICVDHGFSEHCTSKAEVRALSEFNRISTLCGQLPTLVSTTLFTTLADKWGRRPVFLCFLTSGVVSALAYSLILAWEESFFRTNWRGVVIASTVYTGLLGGFPLAIFCVFSMISEFTADRSHIRGTAFGVMTGIIAAAGVAGTQLSGVLMNQGPFYVFATASCILVALILSQFLFLQETVPNEVQARQIDWRRTNILSAMLFLVPSAHTRRLHAEDRLHSYEQLCQKILDSNVGSDVSVSRSLIDDAAEGIGAFSPLAGPADSADGPSDGSAPSGRGGLLDRESLFSGSAPQRAKLNKHGHSFSGDATEGLRADAGEGSLAALSAPGADEAAQPGAELASDYAKTPAALKLASAGLPLPPLPPPRGNALLVLAGMIVLLAAATSGEEGNYMPYLKQTYGISDTAMANVSTIDACARLLGSFVGVPIVHRFVSTRYGEMRATQVLIFTVGVIFACLHFCGALWQTTLFKATASVFGVVPGGFIRGLISTEVGLLLQGKVLGAIAAIEVVTAILSSLVFTSIFAETNESMPTLGFIIGGVVTSLTSLLPFLVTDTRVAFNSRRPEQAPKGVADADSAAANNNVQVLPASDVETGDDAFAAALGSRSDEGAGAMALPRLSTSRRIN